jgi:hypothetical protein
LHSEELKTRLGAIGVTIFFHTAPVQIYIPQAHVASLAWQSVLRDEKPFQEVTEDCLDVRDENSEEAVVSCMVMMFATSIIRMYAI